MIVKTECLWVGVQSTLCVAIGNGDVIRCDATSPMEQHQRHNITTTTDDDDDDDDDDYDDKKSTQKDSPPYVISRDKVVLRFSCPIFFLPQPSRSCFHGR